MAGQVEAELGTLELDACPAGHLGDQHPLPVAHNRRVHVVVELRVHLDRTRVQPRLMGESRRPDIGLVGVGSDVGDLRQRVRGAGQLAERAVR